MARLGRCKFTWQCQKPGHGVHQCGNTSVPHHVHAPHSLADKCGFRTKEAVNG